MRPLILAALMAPVCAGCATVIDGTRQNVDILTYPPDAACTITQRGAPAIRIVAPASVLVRRRPSALEITCRHDGYDPLTVLIPGRFVGDTFGNLFFPPGFAIDAATGAFYAYPDALTLPLSRHDSMAAPKRPVMLAPPPPSGPVPLATPAGVPAVPVPR